MLSEERRARVPPPRWGVQECGFDPSVAEPRLGGVRHVKETGTSPRERDVPSVTKARVLSEERRARVLWDGGGRVRCGALPAKHKRFCCVRP